LGLGASSEFWASPPPARPFSGKPPEGDLSFQSHAGHCLSWGSCSHERFLRRVPLLFRRAPPREGSRGTRVARLSSVPSSGFLPLSTVPASTQRVSRSLDPAVCCGPRRFAAFFHAARVPGTSLQSFPFPRSRTHSRGPFASLRVRVRPPPAQYSREIHDRFRRTRQALCPANPPEGGPGRMSRDEGSLRSLSPVASTRVSAPHVPSTSRRHWARRLTAGTPTSKPCSPRESVLRLPRPWPG
jgi:hypothetical protein